MFTPRLVEQRFINPLLRKHAEPSRPTPAQLMQMQEAFVQGRQAIHMSRTPQGDIRRVMPEVDEAAAELGIDIRPSSDQLHSLFPEEIADAGIYLISAAGALGMTPEILQEGMKQRLEQRPIPTAPLRRGARVQFHKQNLAELREKVSQTQEHIESEPDLFTCRGCHHAEAAERVLDALHQVWITGGAAHPAFEHVIAKKIKKNEGRFTPEEYKVRPGEHPHVRSAIAYARQKVREGKWELATALERLQNHHAIVEHDITVDISLFANL